MKLFSQKMYHVHIIIIQTPIGMVRRNHKHLTLLNEAALALNSPLYLDAEATPHQSPEVIVIVSLFLPRTTITRSGAYKPTILLELVDVFIEREM